MSCNDYQERIGPFLDGELDEPAARELEGHLEDCPDCRAEQGVQRRLDDLVDEAYAPPPVDELAWERVWQGVREEIEPPRARPQSSPLVRWAGLAAAALVVGVIGVILALRPGTAPSPPDRLALLEDGAVNMEWVEAGTSDYMPVVTTTEDDVPVVYVYEVGP